MYAKKQAPSENLKIITLHGATVTGRRGRDSHSPPKAVQRHFCSAQFGTRQRPDDSPWWQRQSSGT